MGALSTVTLTGADDLVAPHELRDLSKQHGMVEWGILYDRAQEGGERFPTTTWINRFLKECPQSRRSLHLCNEAVHAFVAGDKEVVSLAAKFNRVQLNLFQQRSPVEADALEAAIRAFNRPVLLPYNGQNDALIEELQAPNLQIIFDKSGGRGVLPGTWPQPLPGRSCAYVYAGGLSPENLTYELPKILEQAKGHKVGIDLETSLCSPPGQFVERSRKALQTVARLTK